MDAGRPGSLRLGTPRRRSGRAMRRFRRLLRDLQAERGVQDRGAERPSRWWEHAGVREPAILSGDSRRDAARPRKAVYDLRAAASATRWRTGSTWPSRRPSRSRYGTRRAGTAPPVNWCRSPTGGTCSSTSRRCRATASRCGRTPQCWRSLAARWSRLRAKATHAEVAAPSSGRGRTSAAS